MSSWIVLTLRGRPSKDYAFSRNDGTDPWGATSDVYATAEADDRVMKVTTGKGLVYAYLKRTNLQTAEQVIADYAPMLRDAVILEANDTTDTGTARYYPEPTREDPFCSDRYAETQGEDGTNVGRIACAVMAARHGILAADPYHDDTGRLDDVYADDGQDLTTLEGVYNE